MRVELSGKSLSSAADVHDRLSDALRFPPYYGRNLDALWDVLTADVERPVHLVWTDAASGRRALGDETFEGFHTLFQRVAAHDAAMPYPDKFTYEVAD